MTEFSVRLIGRQPINPEIPHPMASARSCLALLLSLALSGPALAENDVIGVVAPTGGPYAILGQQILSGATGRITAAGNQVAAVEDGCEAADGARIATQLIAANARIAIGFLCTESLEAALPALKEAGIPAITTGARADILMQIALKNDWPLFRLAPSSGAELDIIAAEISTTWSAEPFALVDDGAVGNHDFVEALRAKLEENGVKPVLTDTLRPGQDQQLTLVRHLSSAGVLRVFVAADRDDIAVLLRDLIGEAVPIGVMTGASVDTTPGTVPLPAGLDAVVLKDPAADPARAEFVKTLRDQGVEPEGYVMPAVAAADVADQALKAAMDENKPLTDALKGRAFDTSAGPIRFTDRHELTENPYEIRHWDGKSFVPQRPH